MRDPGSEVNLHGAANSHDLLSRYCVPASSKFDMKLQLFNNSRNRHFGDLMVD